MKQVLMCAAVTGMLFTYAAAVSAAGDAAAGKQKSATCVACHGADGNSITPEWPKLAGQHPGYTLKQLLEFQAGAKDPETDKGVRINASMSGMVAALNKQDMEDLAAYFAAQTITSGTADPELVALGEQIYRGGDMETGISACMACHGPTGAGNPAANFPTLAGQHATYTEIQMKAFRSQERANDPSQMMRDIAAKMSDAQIKAVASYIQGLH